MILFEAISYLDDRDILLAWEAAPRRGANRPLLIRALLAALLAALLLSACAAVYLSLEKRLTPSSDPQRAAPVSSVRPGTPAPEAGGYLSHDRGGDSPAAMASAAWADYRLEYTKGNYETDTAWFQGDETLEAAHNIYGAYTPEMADKLFEIRDQYGVRLHSASWGLQGPESLYQAAGTGNFFLAVESGLLSPHKIFEDGSFVCEGTLDLPAGEDGWCLFRLERNSPDALYAGSLYVPNPADFRQWAYTTPGGDRLSLALRSDPDQSFEARAFAFYETEDWTVILRLDFPFPAGRGTVEALVNGFDYQALCTGGDNVQNFFAKGPTVSSHQALSLADFLAAPEVLAAATFTQRYADYLSETMGREERWKGTGFRHSSYYGGWPSGAESLDALAEEIWRQYDLLPASEGLYNVAGAFYGPEAVYPWGAFKSEYAGQGEVVTRQRLREWLGSEIADQWDSFRAIYSNGCFDDGGVYYLKKGCFYTSLGLEIPSADLLSWVYDTAWGSSVTIAVDESIDSFGQYGPAYILYETESAYVLAVAYSHEPRFLEETADNLDLSRLP